MPTPTSSPSRCPWARNDLAIAYHDAEWGKPLHDDRALFELLILEGAQAGLSWDTILKKRDNYRAAFAGFDPEKVARFGKRDTAHLLANPGIVRNRLKIDSAIRNARALLAIYENAGSSTIDSRGVFDILLWQFVNDRPITNRRRGHGDIPAKTPESDAMSKALKRLGFNFVGSTICYAFMQATGMVNDHLVTCFRHGEVGG